MRRLKVEGRLTIIAQEEFTVNPVYSYWSYILALLNKIERRISWIQEALCVEGFQVYDLEALYATNAKF